MSIASPGKVRVENMSSVFVGNSRCVAASLVLLVAAQMSEAAVLPVQEPQAAPQTQAAQQTQPAQQPQPDTASPAAPAAGAAGTDATQQPAAAQATQPAPGDTATPGLSSRSQEQQPQDGQAPVGTAVAPYARPTGVAGSRPAGAAIAPAKQRRVKAIVIRVSLIVAAAAATGAVIGLSKSSSSTP